MNEAGTPRRTLVAVGLIATLGITGLVFVLVDRPAARPLAVIPPVDRNDHFREIPSFVVDSRAEYRAAIVTARGTFEFELFPGIAPNAVGNFVFLARQGFYDGLSFHRVIDEFIAQGGDPLGSGVGGPGYRFAIETVDSVGFDRKGLLAMANAGPNGNGSQFFVTLTPAPHLDGRYTIFGRLIRGEDVLDSLVRRVPSPDSPRGTVIERVDVYGPDG